MLGPAFSPHFLRHEHRVRCTFRTWLMLAVHSASFQRLENMARFLDLLKTKAGVHTVNIGPEDLEEGRRTLVLGLTV